MKKQASRKRGAVRTALTPEEQEALWTVYQQNPRVRYVAKVCHVSQTTVRKYRDRGRWNERLAKIIKAAQKKADDETADQLTNNMKWLKTAKQTWGASVYGKVQKGCPNCGFVVEVTVPRIQPKFGDLNWIIGKETEIQEAAGGSEEAPKRVHFPLPPPGAVEQKS